MGKVWLVFSCENMANDPYVMIIFYQFKFFSKEKFM